MGTPEIKRIPQLDGIRGLAILLVMLFHFFWFPMAAGLPISANDSWLRPILLSCWVGVDLFFVLSGFLITGILVDARARPGYFKNFYARRVLRIFPLYYLFLAAWLALTGYQSLWLWSYTANIHMAREGWTAVPSAVDHLWSLAIEEQYYLLWPVVIYFLKPKQALFVCAGLAMLCPLIRFHYFHVNQPLSAYMLTHARLDSLAWGALLALAVRVCPPSRRLLGGVALFFMAAVLGLVLFKGGELASEDFATGTIGLGLLAAFFASLIGLSLRGDALGILTAKPLTALGTYSYALYLLHQPIAWWLAEQGRILRWTPDWAHSSLALEMIFYFTIPFTLSLALAKVTWHLWERPFLRLKQRFY